jgi:hypothetical protein
MIKCTHRICSIEHLDEPVLRATEHMVFACIQPLYVLVSTPNCEYNVVFDFDPPTKFRHDDHRFEWTRAQFAEWCALARFIYDTAGAIRLPRAFRRTQV